MYTSFVSNMHVRLDYVLDNNSFCIETFLLKNNTEIPLWNVSNKLLGVRGLKSFLWAQTHSRFLKWFKTFSLSFDSHKPEDQWSHKRSPDISA